MFSSTLRLIRVYSIRDRVGSGLDQVDQDLDSISDVGIGSNVFENVGSGSIGFETDMSTIS